MTLYETSAEAGFKDTRIEVFCALLNNCALSTEGTTVIINLLDSQQLGTIDDAAWAAFIEQYRLR